MKQNMLDQKNLFRPIETKDLRAARIPVPSEGKDLRAAAPNKIAETPARNLFKFDA
jgi:hypothetical protein